MTTSAARELKKHKWTVLPSSNVLGLYSDFAQYIELFSVTSTDFHRAASGDLLAAKDMAPLLAHEACHWMDHISTLWGQHRLLAGFGAMAASVSNDPGEFWRIADYRHLIARDHFEDYYTVSGSDTPSPGSPEHMQWNLHAGARFDIHGKSDLAKPIFNAKLRWGDGSVACRVPFSVAALLECNAMNSEWEALNLAIGRLNEDEQAMEFGLAAQRIRALLHTPSLAKYTISNQVVATLLSPHDLQVAAVAASSIASLCLNLPDSCFDSLAVPEQLRTFGDHCGAAIRARDRGFAFLALAYHAPQFESKPNREWLNRTCARAGLPTVEEIEHQSNAEAKSLWAGAHLGPYRTRAESLIAAGGEIRSKLGFIPAFRESGVNVFTMPLPPILCSDVRWMLPATTPVPSTVAQVEAWVGRAVVFARQMDTFMLACLP